MIRDIERLATTKYDLLVIGGGINGAAIAHIAAKRGLKVALVEKGDFASGTSSKSTKLIHGGIRYLENLEFDLVYESLHERYLQLQIAPHLVKPLSFIIPVYKNDKRPLWMMHLGVFLYDLLAGKYSIGRHKKLSANDLFALEPNLKKEGLKGGVMYFDAQMDDARLCLENVLSAAEYGADVANYTEIMSFIKDNGKIIGAKAKVARGTFDILAKKTICAVGPWTNFLLRMENPHAKKIVRTTKGVHIVYRGQITKNALLIQSKQDNRIFFVIPWMGHSLIGTTDTDYIGQPDRIEANQKDIDYLVRESKRVFQNFPFSADNIISVFAGLRPLVRSGGVKPSKASRKHTIIQTDSGLMVVIGGKYTTYRKIAEDCVNQITAPRKEKDFHLYGSGTISTSSEAVARKYHVDLDIASALMEKYGTRYVDVLKLTEHHPELKERVFEEFPVIKAQIIYSIKIEMAQTAADIILRRLSVGYVDEDYLRWENKINAIAKRLAGLF